MAGVKIGERSGKQTAVGIVGRTATRNAIWLVRCDCGRERDCSDTSFRRSLSCGKCGPTLEERFWSKVSKAEGDGCWEWTAVTNPETGYGVFSIHDAPYSAHRVSWEMHSGPIPRGVGAHGTCVLHRCDNRKCVRPSHLFLGTQAENLADMDAKGRRKTVASLGEAQGNAKLTDEKVREIRRRAAAGERHRDIAGDVGVNRSTVSSVAGRRSWAHVE